MGVGIFFGERSIHPVVLSPFKAIMGHTGHRDLCTEACTATWRICREGGFAAAQTAIQHLDRQVKLNTCCVFCSKAVGI